MRWPAACMLLSGCMSQAEEGVLRACLLVHSCQLLQLHLQTAHLGLRHHKGALSLSHLPLPLLADGLFTAPVRISATAQFCISQNVPTGCSSLPALLATAM